MNLASRPGDASRGRDAIRSQLITLAVALDRLADRARPGLIEVIVRTTRGIEAVERDPLSTRIWVFGNGTVEPEALCDALAVYRDTERMLSRIRSHGCESAAPAAGHRAGSWIAAGAFPPIAMTPTPVRFFTDAGTEVPAVTAAQMREIDRIATEETGPSLFQMMENAGRNLALQALDMLGAHWRDRHTVVLAGGGGNGGGGICAARHLANRGARVTLVLAARLAAGSVPAFQHRVYTCTSGSEIPVDGMDGQQADLIIDALIGYGLSAVPRGTVADAIACANGAGVPILSLDVPSGVDATTGATGGIAIRPHWTMTLALPKTGLRPDNAGNLVLADIGLPSEVFRRAGIPAVQPFGPSFRIPLTVS